MGAEAEEGGAEADGRLVDVVFDEFEEPLKTLLEGCGSCLPDDIVMMRMVAYLMSLAGDFGEDLGLALGEFAEDEEGGCVAGLFEEFEGLGEVSQRRRVIVAWGTVVLAGVPVL